MNAFTDPKAIAHYAEETPRRVPGLADLHRMTMLLLAERAPPMASFFVVGAGGGMEIKALSEARESWRFVGIDPSVQMLDLAARVLAPVQERVTLQHGYVDAAEDGPFDGATCLLTLHFLERDERLHTLREIHRRLKPGAPLVVAHHSVPEGGTILQWMTRSAAFADRDELYPERASNSAYEMASRLPLLSAAEEEALLREAGFSGVALFYAGFTFRGWIANA